MLLGVLVTVGSAALVAQSSYHTGGIAAGAISSCYVTARVTGRGVLIIVVSVVCYGDLCMITNHVTAFSCALTGCRIPNMLGQIRLTVCIAAGAAFSGSQAGGLLAVFTDGTLACHFSIFPTANFANELMSSILADPLHCGFGAGAVNRNIKGKLDVRALIRANGALAFAIPIVCFAFSNDLSAGIAADLMRLVILISLTGRLYLTLVLANLANTVCICPRGERNFTNSPIVCYFTGYGISFCGNVCNRKVRWGDYGIQLGSSPSGLLG
jgi:hypothetical protein